VPQQLLYLPDAQEVFVFYRFTERKMADQSEKVKSEGEKSTSTFITQQEPPLTLPSIAT